MRKNELLKMPSLKPTKYMIKMAKKQDLDLICYRAKNKYGREYPKFYSRFYRIKEKDGILKVAIWSRQSIVLEKTMPDAEIYINKAADEWQTYYPEEEKWGKARIQNIQIKEKGECYGDWYGVKGYDQDSDRKKVNEYLGFASSNYSIREAILQWQKAIADATRFTKYRAEQEYIDSIMEQVPELPKDFEDWVQEEAFANAKFIIFNREKGLAQCTRCGNITKIKASYKHNEQGRCEKCKKVITFKSYKKQKSLIDWKNVGIIQELNDKSGYILRKFNYKVQQLQSKNYEIEIFKSEDARFLLDKDFRKIDTFEWGDYKKLGRLRWCHEQRHGLYYYGISEECVLYHRNLTRMLKNTKLKYTPVAKLLREKKVYYLRPSVILTSMVNYPVLESLIKIGLYNYSMEIADRPYSIRQWNKESPWDYLSISKNYLSMAIENDAKGRQIEVMQIATAKNKNLNWQQIKYLTKVMYNQAEELLSLGHTEKLLRYLENIEKELGIRYLGDYLDYINDLKILDMPLDKSTLFPKNFMAEHQALGKLRKEKEEEIEKRETNRRNRQLRKMIPGLKKMYFAEDDEYITIFPTCKDDFVKEGQAQHNCVGRNKYFEKMAAGECVVLFLRKKEDPEKSYCTVEISTDGNVKQNRVIYNQEAPEEAQNFVNKLARKAKRKMKISERLEEVGMQ